MVHPARIRAPRWLKPVNKAPDEFEALAGRVPVFRFDPIT